MSPRPKAHIYLVKQLFIAYRDYKYDAHILAFLVNADILKYVIANSAKLPRVSRHFLSFLN